MLGVSDAGYDAATQLRRRPNLDDRDLAYLAAVDIVDTYPVQDVYDLANRTPFLGGDASYRLKVVREWLDEGLIEKGKGW